MIAKHNAVLLFLVLGVLFYSTDVLGGRKTRCQLWFLRLIGLGDCPSEKTFNKLGWVYGLVAVYVWMNPSIVYRYL